MAQLNIYVPDELAERLKQEARRSGLSLSGYVASRLDQTADDDWPAGYFEQICGFAGEDLSIPGDLPAEPLR